MPKRCETRHLGSAAVVVRKKQTQGLKTHHLKPHPLSSSLEQESTQGSRHVVSSPVPPCCCCGGCKPLAGPQTVGGASKWVMVGQNRRW